MLLMGSFWIFFKLTLNLKHGEPQMTGASVLTKSAKSRQDSNSMQFLDFTSSQSDFALALSPSIFVSKRFLSLLWTAIWTSSVVAPMLLNSAKAKMSCGMMMVFLKLKTTFFWSRGDSKFLGILNHKPKIWGHHLTSTQQLWTIGHPKKQNILKS